MLALQQEACQHAHPPLGYHLSSVQREQSQIVDLLADTAWIAGRSAV